MIVSVSVLLHREQCQPGNAWNHGLCYDAIPERFSVQLTLPALFYREASTQWIVKVHTDVFSWIYSARNIVLQESTSMEIDTNISVILKHKLNELRKLFLVTENIAILLFMSTCFSVCIHANIYIYFTYPHTPIYAYRNHRNLHNFS